MHGLFVTGSNTGVGKTQISCAIGAKLTSLGKKVIPRKPVESGCELIDGRLFAKDAEALKRATQTKDSLETICPFKFPEAIAPAQAAFAQGLELKLQDLVNACQTADDEFVIVEGAGGWLSPVACDGSNADLAVELKLDIILVIEHTLGCINQTLLSVESITHRNLNLHKIYLNQINPQPVNMNDFEYLQSVLDISIINIPHSPNLDGWQKTQQLENLI